MLQINKIETYGPLFSPKHKLVALLYGIISISLFLLSVLTMIIGLYSGMQTGYCHFSGIARYIFNTLLIAQFPVLHSLLLSRYGKRFLSYLAPQKLGGHLSPTVYVLLASLQIILVFTAWSPDHRILWEAQGATWFMHVILFSVAWILLGLSMWQGHLGIQMGYIGWFAVIRNLSKIPWPGLPTKGLFRICRQPIYFSFMLTLWTNPVWTVDKLYLGSLWTLYCYFGPRFKERRLKKIYGDTFSAYSRRTPYWPTLLSQKSIAPDLQKKAGMESLQTSDDIL